MYKENSLCTENVYLGPLLSGPSTYSVGTAARTEFKHMIMSLSGSSSYSVDTTTIAVIIHMIYSY